MIKTFILALALSTKPTLREKIDDFPKNLPEPQYVIKEGESGIRFWILLEPKCIIENVYTSTEALGTEITFLDPENTKSSTAVELVNQIEDISQDSQCMTFAGTDKDACKMYTLTNSGHLVLWERDPVKGHIRKVTILYHPHDALES